MVDFSELLATYGVPTLGVVLSASIYASSFPAVRRARILRNGDSLDATTLTVQFLNAQAWLEYARVMNNPFIWASNTTGAALTTFYLATILELAVANGKLAIPGKVEVIFALGMVYMVLLNMVDQFVLDSDKLRAALAGCTANILSVLMCLAPALNIWQAIKERSAACIQIPLNIASLICNVVWVVYGLFVKHDPFIWVGCAVAVVSAVAQLATVLAFIRTDGIKRKVLAMKQQLEKVKANAIQKHYEKRFQRESVYLPLEFNSEYLAERLQMRAEAGHELHGPEHHETTTTALMGMPIGPELADAVLLDLAKSSSQLAVVVSMGQEDSEDSNQPATPTSGSKTSRLPRTPSTPTSVSKRRETAFPLSPAVHPETAVQQFVGTLQQVSHVQYQKLNGAAEDASHHVFTMSLQPRREELSTRVAIGGQAQHIAIPDAAAPLPTLELQLDKKGKLRLSCTSMPDLQLLPFARVPFDPCPRIYPLTPSPTIGFLVFRGERPPLPPGTPGSCPAEVQ